MPPEQALPAGLQHRLALAATTLGLEIPGSQQEHLMAYLQLLQRWAGVYNLTALREPAEMLSHHLLDCLAVVPPLRRALAGQPNPRLLDVGSGAGLPGVVLAVLQPQWQIHCVDAVAKKVGFIRQVSAELGLANLHGVHGRVEARSTFGTQTFDLITSRAFASLKDFTGLTRHLLAPNATWMAMKAHLSETERAEVPADLDMFHVEPLQVPELDAARCLVWLRPAKASPTDAAQPRQ